MSFNSVLNQIKTRLSHNPLDPEKDNIEIEDTTDGLGSGSRGPGGNLISMDPTVKIKPKTIERPPGRGPGSPAKEVNRVEWLDKLSFQNNLLLLKNHLTGSVLDYPKPGLDPQVWQADGKMHSNIKYTILKKIVDFFKSKGITKGTKKVIKYVYVIGSLTSYQYNSKSDLDVHMGIDIDELKRALSKTTFWVSDEELADMLNKHWKDELNETEPITAPGTDHPLEFYFEIKGYTGAERSDGVYNMIKDKWVQDPRTVNFDFDLEQLYPKVIEEAGYVLQDIDSNLGDVKRTINDIAWLKETLARFPKEKRRVFKEKIKEKIKEVNHSIQEVVDRGQRIIDERKEKYDPLSKANIYFKYLQRYGYIWLIKQLENELEDKITEEVTVEDLDDVKTVQDVLDQFDCLDDSTIKLSEKVYEDSTIQTSEIPEQIERQIRSIQKMISSDLLSTDEDARGWVHGGLQDLLHITVLFGINAEDYEKAKQICEEFDNIEVHAAYMDYFDVDNDQGKFSCAVVRCDSPQLEALHSKLKNNLENKHQFEYKPHITIAYLQYGSRLDDKIKFEPISWKVDAIEMGMPDGSLKKLSSITFKKIFGSRFKGIKLPDNFETQFVRFLKEGTYEQVIKVLEQINEGDVNGSL